MISDYRNILFIIIPIYIILYVLCSKCHLSTNFVSLMLFVLMTIPAIIILGVIVYYKFNNVVDKKKKDDCLNNNSDTLFCNVWEEKENKCYRGIYNKDAGKCDRDLLKIVPYSVYLGIALIIAANVFFYNMKTKCF